MSKSKAFAHYGKWNKLQEDLLIADITTTNIVYNILFSNVIHNQFKKSPVYFESLEITELLEANWISWYCSSLSKLIEVMLP